MNPSPTSKNSMGGGSMPSSRRKVSLQLYDRTPPPATKTTHSANSYPSSIPSGPATSRVLGSEVEVRQRDREGCSEQESSVGTKSVRTRPSGSITSSRPSLVFHFSPQPLFLSPGIKPEILPQDSLHPDAPNSRHTTSHLCTQKLIRAGPRAARAVKP